MNLQYFEPRESDYIYPNKVARVNFNPKTGSITISPAAVDALKLKAGDQITFAQDKDSLQDWYMALHVPKGLKLGALNNTKGITVQVKNKRLVAQVLDSLKMDGGCWVPTGELTMHGTQPIVPLITRNVQPAKKINKPDTCIPASESTNSEPVA